jgi:hypothetical protein
MSRAMAATSARRCGSQTAIASVHDGCADCCLAADATGGRQPPAAIWPRTTFLVNHLPPLIQLKVPTVRQERRPPRPDSFRVLLTCRHPPEGDSSTACSGRHSRALRRGRHAGRLSTTVQKRVAKCRTWSILVIEARRVQQPEPRRNLSPGNRNRDVQHLPAPRPDQPLRLTPDGRWETLVAADESAQLPQTWIVSYPR